MKSPAICLAQRQIVFFVWITFGERKWSILAKRRGRGGTASVTAANIGAEITHQSSCFKKDPLRNKATAF
jgi:hypothetical protein